MQEQWVKIEKFDDYEISNFGNYRSLKNSSPYPMKPKKGKTGYEQARLCKDGKHHYKYIHRLVAEAFIPNPQNKKYINHIDGIKGNNCAENLEWVTAKENTRHMIAVLGTHYTPFKKEAACL